MRAQRDAGHRYGGMDTGENGPGNGKAEGGVAIQKRGRLACESPRVRSRREKVGPKLV